MKVPMIPAQAISSIRYDEDKGTLVIVYHVMGERFTQEARMDADIAREQVRLFAEYIKPSNELRKEVEAIFTGGIRITYEGK